jgi:hypothetical protein
MIGILLVVLIVACRLLFLYLVYRQFIQEGLEENEYFEQEQQERESLHNHWWWSDWWKLWRW